MEVTSIKTGSWFPMTKLHLKEYYRFLLSGDSDLPLEKRKLGALRRGLKPAAVEYRGGRFDRVTADLNGISSEYFEDGLLSLTAAERTDDPVKSISELGAFYEDKLAPALDHLYSVGAPRLDATYRRGHERTKIVICAAADDREVAALCERLGDHVHFTARQQRAIVHFARHLIVIVGSDAELNERLALAYIFFREYEHKLSHLLNLNRGIWQWVASVRERKTLRLKELPAIRDRLVDYQRDLNVGQARLAQMSHYLSEREAEIGEAGLEETTRALEAHRFAKMRTATAYLTDLWLMLEKYLATAIKATEMLYQENLQKELKVQEFVFLLGAVSGLLVLGTAPGAALNFTAPDGQLLATGTLAAFSLRDLAFYGSIAVFASLIIYKVVRPLVTSFQRVSARNLPSPAMPDDDRS